jgi:Ca2+-transporting ATPase
VTGVDRDVRAGLSSGEAAARLVRYGANAVAPPRGTPWWRRVGLQLRDPLMLVLLAAGVLTTATGDLTDAAVILLVVVVNTSVGVAQEVRADQAVAALRELTAPVARVVRDGQERQLPAAEVVPGDVLVLAEGDVVPADAAIVEAAALLVDEAALTGESVPVDKTAAGVGEGPGGVVSAGTVVVRGRGRAVVTATGADSAMGQIATLLDTAAVLTPLQRRLVGLGRVLAGVAVGLCAVVLVLGLLRGQPLELMVVTAISLVVAAVPESLPAVVTLSLALGARRMAARHAIIRRLPAVETLGSVTVIATDKTGTLTQGRMVAQQLWTPAGEATLTGSGYAPQGDIVRHGRPITEQGDHELAELLRAGVLCNDATLRPPDQDDPEWRPLGDPTEASLLVEAATVAAEIARLRNLQSGHIRAQRRIRQDIDMLLRDADRSEERAGALEAVAEHATGRDPVLTSYGGRPLADRGAIAKALAGAAATGLQQGTRQHPGQWCGLSVEVAPTQAWGASALEVTVRVAYRHAASFECPKSWLQQGQQWRILAGLEQLVQTAPLPGRPSCAPPPRRHGRGPPTARPCSAGRSSTPTSSQPPWLASSRSRRPCATRRPRMRPSPPPRPARLLAPENGGAE